MIVDSFGDHASCSILEGYHHLGILLNQIFRKLMTGRAGFEHFFCSDFVSEGDPPKQTFWYLVYLIIHTYIYIFIDTLLQIQLRNCLDPYGCKL